MKHLNNGNCPKCMSIINKYPGFNLRMLQWFIDAQKKHSDFHVSCAGRGEVEQEECVARGASRAHWGQSSHNYNAALDGFFLIDGKYNLERRRFEPVVMELPSYIEWYGRQGSKFPELPHFELKDWRYLKDSGLLKLVE